MKGDVSISVNHPLIETHRAWLFETDDKHHPLWIPKSQAHLVAQKRGGVHQNILIVAGWLDKKEDLSNRLKNAYEIER